VFLDVFPILQRPLVFETLITHLVQHITSHTLGISQKKKIDVIVGLDARGFLLGPIIALRLGAAFVPVRKAGKLPGKCISASYEKEYGIVSPSEPVYSLLYDLTIFATRRTPSRCKQMQSSQAKPWSLLMTYWQQVSISEDFDLLNFAHKV